MVKLEQDKIIAVAIELLQEQGLERLNMRALAKRLGVQASALYWHVSSKDELFARISFQFYAKAFAAAAGSRDWREWLYALGMGLREALISTRDSARLCTIAAPPKGEPDVSTSSLAAPLVEMGLSSEKAWSFQSSVLAFTLGWAIYEQSEVLHAHLGTMLDFADSHAMGLAALVRGLEVC